MVCIPELRAREIAGEWRAMRSQTGHVDYRRRQVSKTDRLADGSASSPLPPGGTNNEWNVQLGLIETLAVAENAGVLTETFAVVRGDDQPCSLQDPAPVKLVDQLPELLIEIRDAIVISVGGKCHILG